MAIRTGILLPEGIGIILRVDIPGIDSIDRTPEQSPEIDHPRWFQLLHPKRPNLLLHGGRKFRSEPVPFPQTTVLLDPQG
jgi:hypothetical protein